MELLVSKSLYRKLDRIQNSIMDTAEDVLYGLVFDTVRYTLTSTNKNSGKLGAVDSGSYLESFSIMSGSTGRIRSVSSQGRPRNVNAEAVGSQVIATLNRDVARIIASLDDVKGNTGPTVTLLNGSRYARDVEYKYGYRIFNKLRKIYG